MSCAASIAIVANATEQQVGPAGRATDARAPRTGSSRPGLIVLGLGLALLLAGGYRAAVELSEGRVRQLVPVAVGAPLAGELLLLVGVVVLAAAALLIASSRRRRRS
jgi:hypothetical protein